MTNDEMIAVLQADSHGKTIQTRVIGANEWYLVGAIGWDFSRREYRVKPEPRVVEMVFSANTNAYLTNNMISLDPSLRDYKNSSAYTVVKFVEVL